MKKSYLAIMATATVLMAACTEDPAKPELKGRQFAVSEGEGRFVLELNGNAAKDLNARVAALGGTLEFVHTGVGIALVSGLDDASAAQLGKTQGVSAVYADEAVTMSPAANAMEPTPYDAEVTSAANPAASVLFNRQWNMRAIGAPTAWAAGKLGSSAVAVAILDTGIDYDNFDANGLVDLTRSKSFVPSDDAFLNTWLPARNKIEDLNGHGTNVAAQVSSNGGFFGAVNSRTTLIGVKVLGRTGSGSLGGILSGILWAADQGAAVANMSLGVSGGVPRKQNGSFVGLTNKVFNYANSKGMLIVVSAGNDATDLDTDRNIFQPYCDAPHVVCVSALGPRSSTNTTNGPWFNVDDLAFYSNYGKTAITVSAPGGSLSGFVYSICARRRVFGFNSAGAPVFSCNTATPTQAFTVGYAGTSQASPHVAGLAAKLVEVYGKNPAQIKHALIKSADDLGAPGKDAVYGNGRINVPAALGL